MIWVRSRSHGEREPDHVGMPSIAVTTSPKRSPASLAGLSSVTLLIEQPFQWDGMDLVEAGYGWDKPALSSLGYRQFEPYFRGEMRLEEAVASIKKETRRFVRQQYNWFRLDDPQIHWVDVRSLPAEYPRLLALVNERLDLFEKPQGF